MEPLEILRDRLKHAKQATVEALANLTEFHKGESLGDGQMLQHTFLMADALEVDIARQVRDAEDLLDVQGQ